MTMIMAGATTLIQCNNRLKLRKRPMNKRPTAEAEEEIAEAEETRASKLAPAS